MTLQTDKSEIMGNQNEKRYIPPDDNNTGGSSSSVSIFRKSYFVTTKLLGKIFQGKPDPNPGPGP